MTRLTNREPATDLPSTPATSASDSTKSGATGLLESQPSSTQKAPTRSIFAPKAPAEASPRSSSAQTSVETTERETKDAKLSPKSAAQTADGNADKAGFWRKLGRAIKRYPNISQTLIFALLISGTSVALLSLLFKDAWSDRHDNTEVIATILKMELNREDVRVLNDSPERVVTHTFETLEPHVESDGWTWVNRFGNTITYGKQDQRMIASCAPYSPLYMVCDLGEIPK